MHAAVEYVALVLNIILIIVLSVSTFFNIVAPLDTINRERLKLVAQKIENRIILSPGTPPDWGKNINISTNDLSDLYDVGLASISALKGFYTLESDKIVRLIEYADNPFYIPPNFIKQHLGIWKTYGFRLTLIPVIKFDVKITSHVYNTKLPQKIIVYTRNFFGNPQGNVIVTVYYFIFGLYSNSTSRLFFLKNTGITSILSNGSCLLDFSYVKEFYTNKTLSELVLTEFTFSRVEYLLIIQGSIANLRSIGYYPRIVPNATSIGRYISLRQNYSLISNNSVIDIAPPRFFTVSLNNVTHRVSLGDNFKTYYLSYIEPGTYIVVLLGKYNNTLYVNYAVKHKEFTYQTSPSVGASAVTIYRYVDIDGFSYVAVLTVWEVSG